MSHFSDSSDDDKMSEAMDTSSGPSTTEATTRGEKYYNLRITKKQRALVRTANFDYPEQKKPKWSKFSLGTEQDPFTEKVSTKFHCLLIHLCNMFYHKLRSLSK